MRSEAQQSPARDLAATAGAVERLIALEPDAWQELFQQHHRRMYNFAYVRTGDPSLAEEIASEVFAAAAQAIARYRPTGAPIAAWLYRIARNITADHLERRRRHPQTSLDGVEIIATGWAPAIERSADLAQVLRLLTREQQEVIALRFFDDCSLAETAAALGRSVGAVKVMQHRALAALKRHLGGSRL
ncbi:MAG: sigma-70 family RNA polymerase sigma factor [Dehalococcoidia bacterium]|nr:sigma-70 family RNA polymerase sigma factor [Dehalococcoidia bacterium]